MHVILPLPDIISCGTCFHKSVQLVQNVARHQLLLLRLVVEEVTAGHAAFSGEWCRRTRIQRGSVQFLSFQSGCDRVVSLLLIDLEPGPVTGFRHFSFIIGCIVLR